MLRGLDLLVHFSGKVLDLNVRACCMSRKAGRAGDFRRGPLSITLRFARLRQPAAYFASYASASHQSSWAILSRMCWQLLWKPQARTRTGRACRPPRRLGADHARQGGEDALLAILAGHKRRGRKHGVLVVKHGGADARGGVGDGVLGALLALVGHIAALACKLLDLHVVEGVLVGVLGLKLVKALAGDGRGLKAASWLKPCSPIM